LLRNRAALALATRLESQLVRASGVHRRRTRPRFLQRREADRHGLRSSLDCPQRVKRRAHPARRHRPEHRQRLTEGYVRRSVATEEV
jgi:hypothetical protein